MCTLSVSSTDFRRDDPEAVVRLLDAMHVLFELPDDAARMAWIEDRVRLTDDFPSPDRPVDGLRLILLRWWLEIFNRQPVPEAPTGLFRHHARPTEIFT